MFWNIKKFDYEVLILPIDKPILEMNKAEAKAFFDWFINQIPGRIAYLQTQSRVRLDGSEGSLVRLWGWFLNIAEIERSSDTDLQIIREQLSSYPESFVNHVLNQSKRTLSLRTRLILMDIAMYWGQVFVNNYPSISWAVCTSKDDFRNQPVLIGFPNEVYPDKPGMPFPPYHMVSVQASRLLRGNADRGDLLRIHRIWAEKLCTQE